MSLDLAKLVFQVDTTQLDEAVQKLDKIGGAVQNVNKPLNDMGKAGEQASKGTKKVVSEADKVVNALQNVIIKQDLVNQGFSKSEAGQLANVVKVFGQSSVEFEMMKTALVNMRPAVANVKKEVNEVAVAADRTTRAFMTMEERQKSITQFMTQGFSRGQAAILTTAKAAGAAADELGRIGTELQTQRKLQGGDPFDKSLSGLTSLKNRLTELREATRQYNAGMQLTREQTRELARDKERIIEKLKLEGAGFAEIRQAVRAHNEVFIEASVNVNRLVNSEKEMERQHRDSANAVRNLAIQEEKLNSVIATITGTHDNGTKASQRAADSIARYERNLRLAGIAGTEASRRLEEYRRKILQVQTIEEKRKVDMLSRSLAPQISDVAVSLGSGMNPLTVLLQQGLQIRDLIGLSGVAAVDLQKAFRSAASDMIGSIKGTSAALGSLLIGSIIDAGKAVGNLGASFLGAGKSIELWRNQLLAANGLMGETPKLVRVLDTALKGLAFAGGVGILALVAGLISLGVALRNVIKEENELAKALILTGGSLGVNQSQAIAFAQSMNDVGISTSKAIAVVTAMAKEGGFSASQMRLVTEAAVGMEKYAGVAIEDTVKAFAKMRDEPVKALIDLAKATGAVPMEVVKMVSELEAQGKTAEATAIAIKTLADVNREQVDRMKEDYNGFSLFMIELGSNIAEFFRNTFNDLFRKASPREQLQKQLNAVNEMIAGEGLLNFGGGFLGLGAEGNKELKANLEEQLRLLDKAEMSQQRVREERVKDAKSQELFNKLELEFLDKSGKMKREIAKATQENQTLLLAGKITEKEAEQRIQNIREKYRDKKGPKTQEQKDLETFAKWIERIADLTDDARKIQDQYTRSQKLALDIFNEPAFARLPEKLRQELVAKLELAHVEEERAEKAEKARKIEEQYASLLDEVNRATGKSNELSEFYGGMLDKINEARLEGVITLQQEIDLLNQVARARFDAANKVLTEKNEQNRIALGEDQERAVFEASSGGMMETERNIARQQLEEELNLRKQIKEIEDSNASPEQKTKLIVDAIEISNARNELIVFNEEMARAEAQAEQFADIFADAFGDLISGSKSFEETLGDLTNAIHRMITEILVLEPLKASLKGAFGGITGGSGGDFFGNLMSGIGGLLGFADGGRPPVGKVSIVGEEGPELFKPDVQGTIIPNHKVDGFLGSRENNDSSNRPIQITQTFVVQGNTSKESQNQMASAALSGAQIALRRQS